MKHNNNSLDPREKENYKNTLSNYKTLAAIVIPFSIAAVLLVGSPKISNSTSRLPQGNPMENGFGPDVARDQLLSVFELSDSATTKYDSAVFEDTRRAIREAEREERKANRFHEEAPKIQ